MSVEASTGEKTEARIQARSARLELYRALSANAHRDVLTPEEAIRDHLDLLVGTSLVLELCDAFPPRDEEGYRLHAMLLTGEVGNLLRVTLGVQGKDLPELEYQQASGTATGAHVFAEDSTETDASRTGRGTGGYIVNQNQARGPGDRTTMVHEVRHGAQAASQQFPDRRRYAPREAMFSPAEVISRSLEASRAMPMVPRLAEPLHYATQPIEVDANAAQAVAASQLSDGDWSNQTRLQNCGLEVLKPLLATAAQKLETRNWMSKMVDIALSSMFGTDPTIVKLKPGESFSLYIEEILRTLASLNRMAGSEAWTPDDAAELSRRMHDAHHLLTSNWARGLDGVQHVAELADTLLEFHDEFIGRHGLRAAMPRGGAVSPETASVAKTMPWAHLHTTIDGGSDAAGASRVFGCLEAAKWESGFVDAVEAIQAEIDESGKVDPRAVENAVVMLAAALTGIASDRWPPALRPEVDVFPTSEDPPAIDGFNSDAAGQRHKTTFLAQNLQFHVPASEFSDPEKVEARLAGIAADLAYTVGVLVVHEDWARRLVAGGLHLGPLAALMSDAGRAVDELRPGLLEAADRHPEGAPYLLYRRVLADPDSEWKSTDQQYHNGPRAAVKAAAREGDVDAEALHRAKTYARSSLPPVAYRRAVKGTTPVAGQYDRLEVLSPAARHLGQVAAFLGTDFSRDYARDRLHVQVSDADWDTLHDSGILREGLIAGAEIAALMKRDMAPPLRRIFRHPDFRNALVG